MSLRVSALAIYPVKSMRAVPRERLSLDIVGPVGDRRFMVVDPEGGFVSQRACEAMARIGASLEGGRLVLRAEGAEPLELPGAPEGPSRRAVVWGDEVDAVAVEAADAWISERLGRPVHLVYVPAERARQAPLGYAREGDRVGFADGFSLLVTTEASLAELNARLAEPVPMDRFRPNIVVSGGEPWDEDRWRRIRVGEVELELVKGCARCLVTTTDQRTGVRGKEPLRTLATYRRREDGGVYFGVNAQHRGLGEIALGDPVEVLERA